CGRGRGGRVRPHPPVTARRRRRARARDREADRVRDAGDSARARPARRLPHSARSSTRDPVRAEGGRPRRRGEVRADGVAPGRPSRRGAAQGRDRGAEDRAAGVVRRGQGLFRLVAVTEPGLRTFSSMTAPLRRVLLRPPQAGDLRFWREYGWRVEPEAAGIADEHKALCELLAGAGAEVVLAEAPVKDDPDAIYVYDPALNADDGA